MLSQEKLGTLRSLLRQCLGQNATRISPPVVSVAREAIEPSCHNDRYARHPSALPICALISCSSIAIENREASMLSLILWMLEDLNNSENYLSDVQSYGKPLGEAILSITHA